MIMLLYLLFITVPVGHYLLLRLPFWEAAHDAARILANSSANTLQSAWHRANALRRAAIVAGVSFASTAPLLALGWLPWLVAAVGLGLAGGAWFYYKFDGLLSQLRGLPSDYVSYSAYSAGKIDSFLWRRAWGQVHPDLPLQYAPDALVAATAGHLLTRLRRAVLIGGAVVYAGAVVLLWWMG